MKIDVRALAQSVALITAVLFILCSIAVAVSPEGFMATAGYLSHTDLSPLAMPITWGSFFLGLVVWTLGVALTFGAGAMMYNRFLNKP